MVIRIKDKILFKIIKSIRLKKESKMDRFMKLVKKYNEQSPFGFFFPPFKFKNKHPKDGPNKDKK